MSKMCLRVTVYPAQVENNVTTNKPPNKERLSTSPRWAMWRHSRLALNHPRCNPHNGRHSAAAPMLKHCAVSMWLFMSVPHQWLFMPCLCRLCRLGGSKAITRIQWTWAETGGYLSCFESSPQTQSDCNGIVMAKQLWDWLWGVNVSKSRCRLKACQLASANPLISSQGGLVQGNEPLEQRIDISPHFSAAPAGGPVRTGNEAPWSPNHLAPGYLTQVERELKAEAEREAEHGELQRAMMELPPVPAKTSAARMLESEGTDLSRSRTRSYRDRQAEHILIVFQMSICVFPEPILLEVFHLSGSWNHNTTGSMFFTLLPALPRIWGLASWFILRFLHAC